MARPKVAAAGGYAAIRYVLKKGREAGGLISLYRRLRSRNACKTCALGMGGQRGGMVNESGHFPEVCKKSIQAQAGDMAGTIPEAFFDAHSLQALARYTPRELETRGRLAFPVITEPGNTHYRRISWDEALDRCGRILRDADPERCFFYASGRASNEAAFLLQLVARAWGCRHIHNCSYYCHSASGVALNQVYGSGTASITLDDLARADFALVVGANPACNHPRLITQLVNLRRRGGRVMIVNPLKELGLVRFRLPSQVRSMLFGSQVSDLYLQPHIGGDVALFTALLKGLIERDALDRNFIADFTSGWEAVCADAEAQSWEALSQAAGVERAEIDAAVDMLSSAERGIVLWAMGLTHHEHGVDNILALSNVALARGWLGRRGAGLLPIRGHSNVQGVHSVGVTPKIKASFQARLTELYGIPDLDEGQDTYGSMEAADAGNVQAAVLLGGNLFASNPDRAWAAQAMRKVGATIHLTTKLNEGHIHGRGDTSLILPVLARDEEPQKTSQESMFNFVRLSNGGTPAVPGDMRSEVDIVASLAERLLPPGRFDWSRLRSHAALREEMSRSVPGYERVGDFDHGGQEFQIPGRTFHAPTFGTPDGRASFHVTPMPAPVAGEKDFRLMTLRSEGQFNTVVYEEEDLYRGNSRRDVVMMSVSDARRLGVREGDRVVVQTETGHLAALVAEVDIRPGNLAMYYPEANALVPRRIDRRSGTPAFKSVRARILPVSVMAD